MATTATTFIPIPNPNKPLIINSSTTSHKLPISIKPKLSTSLAKTTALASTIVANLTTSPEAMAAKQIAESPDQDNRTLALLIPVMPAIGWVLCNILGPALNQINRMRSEKSVILGLGLSGSVAAVLSVHSAALAATEAIENGDVSSDGGNRGLLVLFVAAAVLLEVILFSTMQSGYSESEKKGTSD